MEKINPELQKAIELNKNNFEFMKILMRSILKNDHN